MPDCGGSHPLTVLGSTQAGWDYSGSVRHCDADCDQPYLYAAGAPAQDSWQTPAAFLLSALFIGSLALSLVSQGAVGCQADKDQNGCTSRLFAGLALVAVLMIVGVIAAFAQTHGLSVEQSTAVMMTLSSPWFYVRLVLGLIVPAAAALMVFSHRGLAARWRRWWYCVPL